MPGKKVEFIVCLDDHTWCTDVQQVPIDGDTDNEELEEWWMETQLSEWGEPVAYVGVYCIALGEEDG